MNIKRAINVETILYLLGTVLVVVNTILHFRDTVKETEDRAMQQLHIAKDQLSEPDVNVGMVVLDGHEFVYFRSGTDITVEHSSVCKKCH